MSPADKAARLGLPLAAPPSGAPIVDAIGVCARCGTTLTRGIPHQYWNCWPPPQKKPRSTEDEE